MKALIKLKPEPGFSLEQVPMPLIGDQDVLIKINTTSLCGTDLHIYNWDDWAKKTLSLPLIPGHEFMGEIVKLGGNVSHLKVGDRVSGEGHLTCGICRLCRSPKKHLCANIQGLGIQRQGAFAEYLSLPARNVIELPDNISNDMGSILDPLGNAFHCVSSADIVGEDVLITGAGPIGLMSVALLKHLGTRTIVITDLNAYRLTLAKTMGATHVVNVKETTLDKFLASLSPKFKLSIENGFTDGLEMSGNIDAIHTQIEHLAPGSTLMALGISAKQMISIDWNTIIFKGLTIKGIYGREMFETWTKIMALLQSGLDLSPLITHHFEANDFQKAFETAKSGQAGKILLHWE